MQTLSEKRVYGDRVGARTGYVASETGLVRVRVTGTSVGEFSLVDRRSARGVVFTRSERDRTNGPTEPIEAESADPEMTPRGGPTGRETDPTASRSILVVATDEDVLVGYPGLNRDGADSSIAPSLVPTGFGPAVAVGAGPDGIVAASPTGELRRLGYDRLRSSTSGGRASVDASDVPEAIDGQEAPDDWNSIDAPDEWEDGDGAEGVAVTTVSPPFVGTDSGVYRLDADALRPAGLDAVGTIANVDGPLVGTDAGLYARERDWVRRFDGPVDAVTALEPRSAGGATEAPASTILASGETLYAEATGSAATGSSWTELATVDGPVVDLTTAPSGDVWAITDDGSLLVFDPRERGPEPNGVRSHPLGIVEPRAIVASPE